MTTVIIQARHGSRRFPGKVLVPLAGVPLVQHVITAAEAAAVGPVVLALAGAPEEAPLIAWAQREAVCEVYISPAPVDDVLARFAGVLGWYPEADPIVRLTADCPLLPSEVIRRTVDRYQGLAGCEYCWTDTHSGQWPDGYDVEVVSRRLLLRAHAEATDPSDREHVTPWVRRQARVASVPADPRYQGGPKVSVDDESDLALVQRILLARNGGTTGRGKGIAYDNTT